MAFHLSTDRLVILGLVPPPLRVLLFCVLQLPILAISIPIVVEAAPPVRRQWSQDGHRRADQDLEDWDETGEERGGAQSLVHEACELPDIAGGRRGVPKTEFGREVPLVDGDAQRGARLTERECLAEIDDSHRLEGSWHHGDELGEGGPLYHVLWCVIGAIPVAQSQFLALDGA